MSGKIELIYGPMFSGKSSELIRKVNRYKHARKECLVVNFYHDNRYSSDSVVSTHDKVMLKAIKVQKLNEIDKIYKDYDVIAIDEGQFFEEIVEYSDYMANQGKIVIVAALDATFERKAFGNVLNLIPKSESVVKLSSVCVECGNDASFTFRTINEKQVQLIGGDNIYKPVCRKCFLQLTQQQKDNQNNYSNLTKLSSNKSEEYDLHHTDTSTVNQFNPNL